MSGIVYWLCPVCAAIECTSDRVSRVEHQHDYDITLQPFQTEADAKAARKGLAPRASKTRRAVGENVPEFK
jgi:hypothetical protein